MSLIGVDNHEFSRVVTLTTISQAVADHGAAAARLLLDAMRPDGDPTPLTIDTAAADFVADIELIVRDSTGPIRAPAAC